MRKTVLGSAVTAAVLLLAHVDALAWTTPADLSPRTDYDSEPTVAVAANGDVVAAWTRELDPYHSVINARVRPAGGTWGPQQTLSIASDWQNVNPSAAIDGRGDALVVWGATNGSSLSETRAAYAPAGQLFQPPVAISDLYGATGDAYPFAAFDGAGNGYAFWQETDNCIHYDLRTPASGWGAATTVPQQSPCQDFWPSYAVAANGDAVVVWSGYGPSYASIRPSGGEFGPQLTLDNSPQSGGVHIAMGHHGMAVAVWADQINNRGYMKAAIRPVGAATFGPAVTLAQVNFTGSSQANVAIDSLGDTTIVWAGGSVSPYLSSGGTVITRLAYQGVFSSPHGLGWPAPYDTPLVAYDAGNNRYVVWRHYDVNTSTSIMGRVLAESAAATQPFSGTPTTISERDRNVWPPALGAGPSGSAVVVWPIGTFESQFWIQETATK